MVGKRHCFPPKQSLNAFSVRSREILGDAGLELAVQVPR